MNNFDWLEVIYFSVGCTVLMVLAERRSKPDQSFGKVFLRCSVLLALLKVAQGQLETYLGLHGLWLSFAALGLTLALLLVIFRGITVARSRWRATPAADERPGRRSG